MIISTKVYNGLQGDEWKEHTISNVTVESDSSLVGPTTCYITDSVPSSPQE